MTPLVFSHANSFGASTYRVLFKDLTVRGFAVSAIDQLGHDPRYPVTNNWPHLVQQLVDFVQLQADQAGVPVFLAGHSLGGFFERDGGIQSAELGSWRGAAGFPLIGGWRAKALGAAKTTPLFQSFSPASVSRKRRNQWADTAAVMAHFQHKKSFAKWDPLVLQDYIDLGTRDEWVDGQPSRVLSFDREIESAIYNSLPHNMVALFKRHPIKCPVTFIGGIQSTEIKQAGMAMTEKIAKGRIMMLDGTHLFPMEKPLATAAALETALRNMTH